jgi:tryptophanyl-tRNA synthetase
MLLNLIDRQQVSAHTELMWILSTVASMGYLSRMTQWKARNFQLYTRALY